VVDVLEAFASPDPTPGGGSAAALSGALGASLLAMVAGLPKTRTGTPEERQALDAARPALLRARDTLVSLIDRDAAAYDLVVLAFRLPKATDADKAARSQAIQAATLAATEVPVETIRACVDALEAGRAVASYGNPSAKSDIAVGVTTLGTAMQGALFNVEINIGGLKDPAVVERIVTGLKDIYKRTASTSTAIYREAGIGDLMRQAAERIGVLRDGKHVT
jgi:formiminotetrahydrofolate cyclodeaminase